MHFQFLIEDYSGAVLINKGMEKVKSSHCFTYDCKAFKGIGGFRNGHNGKEVKTNKLLCDLPIYLKGFDNSLKGIEACIFIVLDNDTRDTAEFIDELLKLADESMITIDKVFCIAVEEMEAWLLGDEKALFSAYPSAKEGKYKEYTQDSICGTWEILADIVYEGGIKKFKKDCPTYREVGKYKAEWAEKIGDFFDIDNNKSPSFQHFIYEIQHRLETA